MCSFYAQLLKYLLLVQYLQHSLNYIMCTCENFLFTCQLPFNASASEVTWNTYKTENGQIKLTRLPTQREKKQPSSVSDFLSQGLTPNFPMNSHYITLLKADLFASTVAAAGWFEFQMKLDMRALPIQVQSLNLLCSQNSTAVEKDDSYLEKH